MKIRSSQMDILDAHSMKKYKTKLCRHLRQYDPLLCEAAGAEALEEAVDLGVQRAHECSFTLNGPIRSYLEIMFVLGSDFDRDPQYFWLRPWLQPQERYPEMERARYLQFHVIRFINDFQGSDNINIIHALNQAQDITREQLIEISRNYPEKAVNWLESMHPLKCRFIGKDALRSLMNLAIKETARAELQGPESVALVLGLMFTFGSGILHDPMYPWVNRILASPAEEGPQTREEKLQRRGKVYLRKILQQIQGIQKNVELQSK
jgi:hypothetical protein